MGFGGLPVCESARAVGRTVLVFSSMHLQSLPHNSSTSLHDLALRGSGESRHGLVLDLGGVLHSCSLEAILFVVTVATLEKHDLSNKNLHKA